MASPLKTAPWVSGVLGIMMTAIGSLPASAQQGPRPGQPFDRDYAMDVARGIRNACREINYEYQQAKFTVPVNTAAIKAFQDGLQAKIYVRTKTMPGDIAEGYLGGFKKFLEVMGQQLAKSPDVNRAREVADMACNALAKAAKSVPMSSTGGFRPPVEQPKALIQRPKGF